MSNRFAGQSGMALLMTLMVVGLLSAMALALALTAGIETAIAANYRRSVEALLAADAGLETVLGELAVLTDWDAILSGASRSPRADGPPEGPRVRPDGSVIDLSSLTNLVNCSRPTACTDGELDMVTAERPWGPNNPRWQPFLFGPLNAWLPRDASPSLFYVVAWVGDDPSETDANPRVDGGGTVAEGEPVPEAGGRGVLLVRVEAYGPSGAHRAVQATVARIPASGEPLPGGPAVRLMSWREP